MSIYNYLKVQVDSIKTLRKLVQHEILLLTSYKSRLTQEGTEGLIEEIDEVINGRKDLLNTLYKQESIPEVKDFIDFSDWVSENVQF